MAIKIKGVIGWDVVGTTFADMISRMSGDIEFEIDSPGGSVFDGISIFNAIRNYNKGKCNMHVVGECSSMAAYIMLAGDSLKFEENSIVVIHNPWTIAIGDYKEMQHQGDILERLAALYATEFVKQGIFDEKTIRSMMDAETWFIGTEELAKLGEVVKSSDENSEPQDKEIAIAATREHIKECKAKLRREMDSEIEKIAALLPSTVQASTQSKLQTKPQTEIQDINDTVQTEKETIMDKSELQAKHADIHAEVLKDGAEKEKERVSALMKFIDVDKDTVIKAIADGKSVKDDEIHAAILMAKVNAQTLTNMETSNPKAVTPGEPEHAPESELNGDSDGETADEKAKSAQAKKDADLKAVLANFDIEA